MKKNVASQVVSAMMVSATDGSAFTSSVTCSVTGDAGTRATGSVGSGACTHEGGGVHSYAPAQAETNYDNIVFDFAGTGAVPAAVQVYTTFPQTGDSFARLGAPAGASHAADIAAIEAQTDDIGAAGAGLTNVPWNAAWDAEVQSEVADALAVYDPPTHAELVTEIDAVQTDIAAVDLKIDTIDTNVDAILDDTGTSGVVIASAMRPGIRKNTALAKFEFLMTDSTNHNPATGLTCSVTRSIDGGAFGAGTLSAVTEVSAGIYYVDFAAGDLNGEVITLRVTAATADDLLVTIVTDP